MEVVAAGTLETDRLAPLLQLLTGLSGRTPDPITLHEIVMRFEGSTKKQELHLHQVTIPAADGRPAASSWSARQYGRPPWGDLALAKLPATVRTVTQSACSGPDVPAFWASLGFIPQYELIKQGYACDIKKGAWTVHILVSRLLRVQSTSASGDAGENAGGGELVPGHVLIEASTEVGTGSHTDAMAAVAAVGKLLGREGVVLQRLPEPPKGARRGALPR